MDRKFIQEETIVISLHRDEETKKANFSMALSYLTKRALGSNVQIGKLESVSKEHPLKPSMVKQAMQMIKTTVTSSRRERQAETRSNIVTEREEQNKNTTGNSSNLADLDQDEEPSNHSDVLLEDNTQSENYSVRSPELDDKSQIMFDISQSDDNIFLNSIENSPTLIEPGHHVIISSLPTSVILEPTELDRDVHCHSVSSDESSFSLLDVNLVNNLVIASNEFWPKFSDQTEESKENRLKLVCLLMKLACEFGLKRETFYLAVNYIDRFLVKQPLKDAKQLDALGIAAFSLATKLDEVNRIALESYEEALEITARDIKLWEKKVLNVAL